MSKKFIVNVEALIQDKDSFLIVKRSSYEEYASGDYALVGGKVETSDATSSSILENTLRREIMEEVGIEVENSFVYVNSSLFTIGNNEQVIDVVFLTQYKSGEAKSLDKREIESVHWMTMKEIMNHEDIQPWTKKAFEMMMKIDKKIKI